MTPKEIIQAGTSGVRSSPTLMAEYKRQFREQFGYEAECSTCGSTKDWNLFQSFANGQTSKNPEIMSDKTFALKKTTSFILMMFMIKNLIDQFAKGLMAM